MQRKILSVMISPFHGSMPARLSNCKEAVAYIERIDTKPVDDAVLQVITIRVTFEDGISITGEFGIDRLAAIEFIKNKEQGVL